MLRKPYMYYMLIICLLYNQLYLNSAPIIYASVNCHSLRAQSTKQSSAGRAIRDKFFTQGQGEAKPSSAGDLSKGDGEQINRISEEWSTLRNHAQRRNYILNLTGDKLKFFIKFADLIAETSPERAFMHFWLQSRALVEINDNGNEYRNQAKLFYKSLLEPEKDGNSEKFMQIFIKSGDYMRYLNLSGEMKLVLVITHYARRGQLEETIKRLQKASGGNRALRIRLNEQDIDDIMQLAGLQQHPKAGDYAQLLKNNFRVFHVNENILHNFLRSVGRNIYPETEKTTEIQRPPSYIQQELFQNHNISNAISHAA
jgi:hypothetical protein